MKKQIDFEDSKGKTIKDLVYNCSEILIAFTDDTFAYLDSGDTDIDQREIKGYPFPWTISNEKLCELEIFTPEELTYLRNKYLEEHKEKTVQAELKKLSELKAKYETKI